MSGIYLVMEKMCSIVIGKKMDEASKVLPQRTQRRVWSFCIMGVMVALVLQVTSGDQTLEVLSTTAGLLCISECSTCPTICSPPPPSSSISLSPPSPTQPSPSPPIEYYAPPPSHHNTHPPPPSSVSSNSPPPPPTLTPPSPSQSSTSPPGPPPKYPYPYHYFYSSKASSVPIPVFLSTFLVMLVYFSGG